MPTHEVDEMPGQMPTQEVDESTRPMPTQEVEVLTGNMPTQVVEEKAAKGASPSLDMSLAQATEAEENERMQTHDEQVEVAILAQGQATDSLKQLGSKEDIPKTQDLKASAESLQDSMQHVIELQDDFPAEALSDNIDNGHKEINLASLAQGQANENTTQEVNEVDLVTLAPGVANESTNAQVHAESLFKADAEPESLFEDGRRNGNITHGKLRLNKRQRRKHRSRKMPTQEVEMRTQEVDDDIVLKLWQEVNRLLHAQIRAVEICDHGLADMLQDDRLRAEAKLEEVRRSNLAPGREVDELMPTRKANGLMLHSSQRIEAVGLFLESMGSCACGFCW